MLDRIPARTGARRASYASEAAVVLVVEDDRSTRLSLRSLLEQEGYQVEEADNGLEAVQLFQRCRADVVLLDAVIPGQDGFATCSQIRSLGDPSPPPVLMITALDDELSVQRAFRAGASDYIPKPINFEAVRQRVHRTLTAIRSEAHAQRLAYHDTLTGLPNRRAFHDRTRQLLETLPGGARLAVFLLDIDRFKFINDSLGHEAGDELLIALARRVNERFGREHIFARMGGDEFALSAVIYSDGDIDALSSTLLEAIEPTLHIGEREIFLSASIGIATYPHDGTNLDTLLKHADTAMYRAKEAGGRQGRVYTAPMTIAVHRRMELENDLRRALDRQELRLFFQPMVDNATHRPVGMEALLRWQHPKRGLLTPGQFIPLAEDTGAIVPIGEWVLREGCAQQRSWPLVDGQALRVAINLSGRQLAEPGLSDIVTRAVADTGISPELLELEVTETVVLGNPASARSTLERLRESGTRITIDDFGTGYSSLSYLKRLPLDCLKIDRSFITDLLVDENDEAIISTILTLARDLNLAVVAEGVETSAQAERLRALGCQLMQGFLFCRPMAAARVPEWLTKPRGNGLREIS